MSLRKGTQLGPYEIVDLIGAGGMGEVYRATDKRLNRIVAVKILPLQFSDDPEMKQRFEREAQTIAGLSHRNICTLHDVGNQDGTEFLVMEFLEGETLAARLTRGPLPLNEALRIAVEIADALDKAHRQGVVHRDLKPANVMLTKTGPKLLDFGLAKLKPAAQSTTMSALPTNPNVTAQGAILGTLQYMSPEQLEGIEADARSDIFSFGTILYEMLSGRKAFEGRSQASLISAIMSAEPQPLIQTQPLTPSALDHVVRTCLRKSPDDRWQTAHDLFVQLQWLASGGAQTAVAAATSIPERKRSIVSSALLLVAALLVLAMAWPTVLYFRGTPKPREIRFLINPPSMPNSYSLAISPDGSRIAFVGTTASGGPALFIREIGSTQVRQVTGTDTAQAPFWSPDSRSIGFTAAGMAMKQSR
jgi:serine/threonine protein kinase